MRLVYTFLLAILLSGVSFSKEFKLTDKDFDNAVIDICIANTKYCKILTDKTINPYLRKYYKPALLSIAYIESNFKYIQGKYDKNDISYFQINKKIWNRRLLKKYNINYTYNQIKYNQNIASKVALKIWLINVAQYISVYKKYPKSLVEYIALYHRTKYISANYKKKIRKVVYKYISKN